MEHCEPYNLEVVTASTRHRYLLDNTGGSDISTELEAIFAQAAAAARADGGGVHYLFAPGRYFINRPLQIRHANVKISGLGHSGVDIHGINIAGGTCFHFGGQCYPACLTFLGDGVAASFPAGESPWPLQCARVELEGLTFVGHNNTDVDTAAGYCRMRGDEPNFRGLKWYPQPERYKDAELEGQRAIVLAKSGVDCKPEMLRIFNCCFTDLYVGVDIEACDVTHITRSWFAQMVYGVRNHGPGQVTNISDNCFADLETALCLRSISMSALHHNSFAYVSKCFALGEVFHSSIGGNVLNNWHASTGAAACGAFCHVEGPARNLTVTANSVFQEHDSRAKTLTIDAEGNGRCFVQFENCSNLVFNSNVIDTQISEAVIRLKNCRNYRLGENIVTHGEGGSALEICPDCEPVLPVL